MIPAHLPALVKTATLGGWDVMVAHGPMEIRAIFTRHDHGTVHFTWDTHLGKPRIAESLINGQPTPYAHCARLIRSDQ